MNSTVQAAFIGLGGAVLVGLFAALYTVGGRGALQRRVIKQELEVLNLLDDNSLERRELSRIVSGRLARYLVRLSPLPIATDRARTRKRWRQLGIWTLDVVAGFLVLVIWRQGPGVAVGAILVASAGIGVGFIGGTMIAQLLLDLGAIARAGRFDRARARLQQLDHERAERRRLGL